MVPAQLSTPDLPPRPDWRSGAVIALGLALALAPLHLGTHAERLDQVHVRLLPDRTMYVQGQPVDRQGLTRELQATDHRRGVVVHVAPASDPDQIKQLVHTCGFLGFQDVRLDER